MASKKIDDCNMICGKNANDFDGLNSNDEGKTPSSTPFPYPFKTLVGYREKCLLTLNTYLRSKNLDNNHMEVKEVRDKLIAMKTLCENMVEVSVYLLSEIACKKVDLEEIQGRLTAIKKLCENITKVISENGFSLMESKEVRGTMREMKNLCENLEKVLSDLLTKNISQLTQTMKVEDVLMNAEKICESILLKPLSDLKDWKPLRNHMLKQSGWFFLDTSKKRELIELLHKLTVKKLCEKIVRVSSNLLSENGDNYSVERKPPLYGNSSVIKKLMVSKFLQRLNTFLERKNLDKNVMEVKEVRDKLIEMKTLCESMVKVSVYFMSENAAKMMDLEAVQNKVTEIKKLCENVPSNSMTKIAFNLMESKEVRDTLIEMQKLCENMIKVLLDLLTKKISALRLTQTIKVENVLMNAEKICEAILVKPLSGPMDFTQKCIEIMQQSGWWELDTSKNRELIQLLCKLTVRTLCEKIVRVSSNLLTENAGPLRKQ